MLMYKHRDRTWFISCFIIHQYTDDSDENKVEKARRKIFGFGTCCNFTAFDSLDFKEKTEKRLVIKLREKKSSILQNVN